jgi:hypothetical protein
VRHFWSRIFPLALFSHHSCTCNFMCFLHVRLYLFFVLPNFWSIRCALSQPIATYSCILLLPLQTSFPLFWNQLNFTCSDLSQNFIVSHASTPRLLNGHKMYPVLKFLEHFSLVQRNNLTNVSICSLKSHWHKITIIRHIYSFVCMVFFSQIQLDGVEGAVFVQRLRTEIQAGNVASAQNGCAGTAVSRRFICCQFSEWVCRDRLSRRFKWPVTRMGVQGPLYQDSSNVASFQNGCAGTAVSRRFKCCQF